MIQGKHPQLIPKDVIQKGCNKYKNDGIDKNINPFIEKVIEVFDGEILGEKYKPPKRKYKAYKKKYVKSPHKYAYRRDAQ